MWKIISIGAKNIVSFKEFKYNIHQGVATLIFGENLDGTNQRHNGSGKSALIEAISLALTGDYLRDIKTTEELINDEADEASVYVVLENDYDKTRFEIVRCISRKESQYVECHKYDDKDNEIEEDKTVQPTVNDYNKFILNEIGLSKDDIYSNFILCRNKYVSFLSAKDKDKKELINRFSNGIIVDESIEALEADMEPVKAEVDAAHDEVVRYNARIETINEQIANAELNKERALQTRAEKIEGLNEKIAQKRAEIRELEETIKKSDARLDLIDELGDKLEDWEKSNKPLSELYQAIKELFEENHLQAISDYSTRLQEAVDTCNHKKEQLATYESQLEAVKQNVESISKRYKEIVAKHEQLVSSSDEDRKKYQAEIDGAMKKMEELDEQIAELGETVRKNRNLRVELASVIDDAKVKLNGAITCPKCQHKFVLSSDSSVEELERLVKDAEAKWTAAGEEMQDAKDKAQKMEADKVAVNKGKSDTMAEIYKIDDKVREHKALVDETLEDCEREQRNLTRVESNIENVKRDIAHTQEQIKTCSKSMFDEAFDVIDSAIKKGEAYVDSLKDKKKFAKEAIAQYEESIEELKKPTTDDNQLRLEESLKEYQKKLEEAETAQAEVQAKLNELVQQKLYFNQFKTYIANTKIDAISSIVNSFLEEIGSDIRVSIEGYRVLKSGKLSEKITINLLRNGVECGAYGKFSGGEKSRVELASILAIQTLTNSACDEGKGLDFVAIDEVLEACDYEGIMAACDTLNKLHKTALVITQNSVAENYPYQLTVTKQNGTSTIE